MPRRLTLQEATNSETLNDCIANQNDNLPKSNVLSMDRTATAATNTLVAASGLVAPVNDKNISEKCSGKLGNKYLIEYGNCKIGDRTEPIYKVVDNLCESGLITCMFNSISRTGSGVSKLANEIFNSGQPSCTNHPKISQYGKGTENPDEEFHVKIGNKMKTGKLNSKVYVLEDFENLYNDVVDHLEENELNNAYHDNTNDFMINNISKINKQILNNNDIINETYYVLLIIFLLFIIYKISNKK